MYSITEFISNAIFIAKRNGMKIGELEQKCGISVGYLSRVSAGKNIKATTMITIAKVLNMKIDEIFEYDRAKDELEDMEKELAELQAKIDSKKAEIERKN